MHELLVRTISGIVLVVILIACIFVSPWTLAALLLFIVSVGTFEMSRLFHINNKVGLAVGEGIVLGAFVLGALVGLQVVETRWLLIEFPILLLPFLYALFSVKYDVNVVFGFLYASLLFLSLPSAMMLFMYRDDLFHSLAGPGLVVLVFCLLWANDIFAYLTGKLLGKHKLFPRISPGKTIEGSLGGLVFVALAVTLFARSVEWLLVAAGVGMAVLAVVFGTLGDLCESMLKRQAGVKDSGKLIPGHGGILDRFDSVMFSVPFIFVYLLLL